MKPLDPVEETRSVCGSDITSHICFHSCRCARWHMHGRPYNGEHQWGLNLSLTPSSPSPWVVKYINLSASPYSEAINTCQNMPKISLSARLVEPSRNPKLRSLIVKQQLHSNLNIIIDSTAPVDFFYTLYQSSSKSPPICHQLPKHKTVIFVMIQVEKVAILIKNIYIYFCQIFSVIVWFTFQTGWMICSQICLNKLLFWVKYFQ